MSAIARVPQEVSGVKDGVQMDVNCAIGEFIDDKISQQLCSSTVRASWEIGTLSITFTKQKENKQVVSIRLDELMALLNEAMQARIETAQKAN